MGTRIEQILNSLKVFSVEKVRLIYIHHNLFLLPYQEQWVSDDIVYFSDKNKLSHNIIYAAAPLQYRHVELTP